MKSLKDIYTDTYTFGRRIGQARGREVDYDNDAALAEMLVGRRIVSTEGDTFTLDNGVVLEAIGNEGCGGCSSGHFSAIVIDGAVTENVITKVAVEDADTKDPHDYESHYVLFVFHGAKKVNLVQADGDWGNGYYGGGFSLRVRHVPGVEL